MTPQLGGGVTDGTADIHYLGIVDCMVNPEEVKDVLAVIGLYEDGDEDCNNALIDHETGLNSSTVDEVLEYLWKSDQIEGVMIVGGRNPSLDEHHLLAELHFAYVCFGNRHDESQMIRIHNLHNGHRS